MFLLGRISQLAEIIDALQHDVLIVWLTQYMLET